MSIACATPRSACGSFSHTARSISSISPRMPEPALNRLSLRFYAKHLPLSREMAKNLQSFGEE